VNERLASYVGIMKKMGFFDKFERPSYHIYGKK
jgi:hypothetical protein